ncbi:MAG: MalY/PatB family protein [Acetivibrionales bacterium]|jgi:cystathionine beta-lyase
MSLLFDEVVSRKNTDSIKYDFASRYGMPEDVLPLWVADMDFRAPSCVIDALVDRSRHGIFGYSESGKDYFEAVRNWLKKRHGWEASEDWLVKTPGVVFAICTAIRALTGESDSVLIQEPVYYPFSESVLANGRKLAVNQLRYDNGRYSIDFDDFERKIREERVRLFILCSPHNPVGRVWTRDELVRMGDICVKHGVIVVSDEIHMDFVYPGYRHLVFADQKPEFLQNSITCTAPSKTFNLPGLQASNIFIPNKDIRSAFRKELKRSGCNELNIMGLTACKAAYACGEEWLDQLIDYLHGNLAYLRSFLNEKLPQVFLVEPEGTYLAWLDFSGLGLSDMELERLIIHKAGLWLSKGTIFGQGGEGFQRINIACPRSILEEAMHRLEKIIK